MLCCAMRCAHDALAAECRGLRAQLHSAAGEQEALAAAARDERKRREGLQVVMKATKAALQQREAALEELRAGQAGAGGKAHMQA